MQHLEDYNQEGRCNGDQQRHAIEMTGPAASLEPPFQVAFFTQICLGIPGRYAWARTAKPISMPA